MDLFPRRKPHRLPVHRYVGQLSVHFTISVQDRQRLFEDREVVSRLLDILERKLIDGRCDVPVYCFMPDHLHIFVRGREYDATPKLVVDRFKLSAGIWLATHRPGVKLHHDYYDHIMRNSEDWHSQARYIALNPVRAGLVEDPFAYPFSGCIGMDWEEMRREIFLEW